LIRIGEKMGVAPEASQAALGKRLTHPRGRTLLTLAELSEKAKKLLKGKNFAFVATINKDGSPQLTPTWVDTDGENVLVNTALGRQKSKNVTRDPRVTVGVFDINNPYEYVSISGKVVTKTTGKAADDHIDKLSLKYRGEPKYKRWDPKEKRVIFTIRPSKSV
jgi:PPOX class probable F420-dependent enzyme